MTQAHIAAPQPLLSTSARAAAAFGVAAVIALIGLGSAQASHTAIDSCTQAFAREATVQVVTLPKVQIVGHRAAA